MRTRKPRTIKAGHCLECNRPLKDPVSKERGLGPVCWAKTGGKSERPASVPGSLFTSRSSTKAPAIVADGLPSANVDTVYRYPGLGGCASHCRLRIWFEYAPEDTEGYSRAIAIVTELDSNEGTSVTNMAEYLWASICREYLLDPGTVLMLEHYPASSGVLEHFDQVRFSGPGRTRPDGIQSLGHPMWTAWTKAPDAEGMPRYIREFQAGGKAVAA